MFNSIRWEYKTTPPSCSSLSMASRRSSYASLVSLGRSGKGVTPSFFAYGLEGGGKWVYRQRNSVGKICTLNIHQNPQLRNGNESPSPSWQTHGILPRLESFFFFSVNKPSAFAWNSEVLELSHDNTSNFAETNFYQNFHRYCTCGSFFSKSKSVKKEKFIG